MRLGGDARGEADVAGMAARGGVPGRAGRTGRRRTCKDRLPTGYAKPGQDPGKVVLVGVDGSVSGRTTLGAAALVVATGARHRHWHSCPARRDAARSDRPAIIASATPTVDATPKERR
jgi:hypothetical protein